MIVNRLLTRKGWRVVAHCMLAGSGVGFLYLLAKMTIESIHHSNQLSPWILGLAITLSLWSVALGSMLAKYELTDNEG